MSKQPTIIYTRTDEAPALATYSLLPILRAFAKPAGIAFEERDISLASRLLAAFPESAGGGKVEDGLSQLGQLCQMPEANIIKLPNISASLPQMKAAIEELQSQGYALPSYPEVPISDAEREIKARYDKVKGSAVNPVLREGNSDRRAPKAVKEYARKHPHSMGKWSPESRTRVASMSGGDFFSNEQSVTFAAPDELRIELEEKNGSVRVLKNRLTVREGEILDGTMMSCRRLKEFLQAQVEQARREGILFSLHLKATMMKVSDPLIFGHAVRVFFADFIEKHTALFDEMGVNFDNGLGDLLDRLSQQPETQREAILKDLAEAIASAPPVAMVNSDKGITNLHVPSDVIVDASMPAAIRSSGKMYNSEGKLQDTLAVIPDSTYAGVYQAVIDHCKEHGAFDPSTMGSVPNVGLMAQAAEEYGSHDKTFEMPADGVVRVVNQKGEVVMEHRVEKGDIWRACQTKDAAVKNWVELAVERTRITQTPAIFWLDENRAHDREILKKVRTYLQELDTQGLAIDFMAPQAACTATLQRLRQGLDTISVTGNVLRDYLTDLFPILELGTSAKMLSIVPLLAGGGLFETGAGGSAPKHVEQFVTKNYLRWDSLGEFLAVAVALEHLGQRFNNPSARLLAETLDAATGRFLENDKSPTRQLGGIDNRGSHFYLTLYWAEELAKQEKDANLKAIFTPLAKSLAESESQIVSELLEVQGSSIDLGGYYKPDDSLATAAMRPSRTFTAALEAL